jgi:CubicO group peptidase (beta-lactamase class C family)
MRLLVFLTWLVMMGVGLSSPANDLFPSITSQVQDWVDRGYYKGCSVWIADDEKVLYQRDFGKHTDETEVYIASSGKWLASAAILAVVDEGKLSLDDPVSKWLPEFSNDPKGKATLRQLFSHTSGYPPYQPDDKPRDGYQSCAESVKHLLPLPLVTAPGEKFDYGGLAMQVAGRMAEVATGKTWETIFQDKIARPLGMTSTRFTPVDPGHTPMLGGGAVSTLSDYSKFLTLIGGDGVYQGKRLISEAGMQAMQADQVGGAAVKIDEYVERARGNMHHGVYGLGMWREEIDGGSNATLISSPSWAGTYPWIDKLTGIRGLIIAHVDTSSAAVRKDSFSGFWSSPVLASMVRTELADRPRVDLTGSGAFTGWKGIVVQNGAAGLDSGGTAVFNYPQGPLGRFKHGMRIYHDGTRDWRKFQGLEMAMSIESGREIEVEATLLAPTSLSANERTSMKIRTRNADLLRLPWASFDTPKARTSHLKFMQGVELKATYTDGKPGKVWIKDVSLIKGESVSIDAPVRGKSVLAGETAIYDVRIGNSSPVEQSVSLTFSKPGWEAMVAKVEPAFFSLKPNETKICKVQVTIPAGVPAGGHEKQLLEATGNGDVSSAARIELITGVAVPPPYLLHTPKRWQEVRDKVKNYPWARSSMDVLVKRAEEWKVPEVAKAPGNDPDDTMGPFLFATSIEHDFMSCGISWQLTGNRTHAEKVALFLRRLSDPRVGYPKTLRACNQGQVQEGHFFQYIAMAYDMVRDAGVITQEDQVRIEDTFRLFIETMGRLQDGGSVNNWNVSEITGAFYCALAMQDLATAERFFAGPTGICDQLAKGTMDDGWWYECSISYNTWVAREFTQIALAYEPWGFNFKDMRVPASYSPSVLLVSELNGGSPLGTTDPEQVQKPFGMDPHVYGPVRNPSREIRQMWNGLLPFLDWRGVMFGVNDSAENSIAAPRQGVEPSPYEVAYYVYRDPAYASVIKRGTSRDLLYGVPELPENTPEPFRESASADNVGLAMLRSQAPQRPIREQIQAVLHYGTHGWAHGHFDRTNLISLMRYGRSFYNPESVWHSYEPFMYKFYVQTSVSKNMVVVDRKMQKATPGNNLLFHTGKMMQATVIEATAPWSNPPYGGMVYDYVPVKSFAEKCWREGRSVPIPKTPPGYGSITDYTEPVRQRRSMIVTDDYVVIADDVEGRVDHAFESLFQMKGFLGMTAKEKQFLRHDSQWDTNPLGSAQFVTDCDWYQVSAPAVSRFEMKFGPGADNVGTRTAYNEDGVLKLDVHTLWPLKQEIMYGTAPEEHGLGQRLFYTVRGDGKCLAEGKFGAWTLGEGVVDIDVDGVKELELETRTELQKRPTLFWGSALVITRDGKSIPVSELAAGFENILPVKSTNMDYEGGVVKIQGSPHSFSTPAQPKDGARPGVVRIDLSKLDAVRFKSSVGSDFPPGPEAQRRKTMSVKAAKGAQAQFLTVIEPYENQPVVKSAVATSADRIEVHLHDGRVQEIKISDRLGGPVIEMRESSQGRELRSESTQN